jgi:Tfp pilus assembly protein PilF
LLREYNQPGQVREIRATLASAYSAAHEPDKSEEQLRLILRADPNDATANNDLGYQLADQGKELEEAERMIRRALELDRRQRGSGTAVGADGDEDNAAYVDSLGWVLFRRGRLEEAGRELQRAASLPGGDDDPTVWDHLGDVRFRQGDRPGAGAAWKKALALYDAGTRRPAEERYREIRQKLKLLEP